MRLSFVRLLVLAAALLVTQSCGNVRSAPEHPQGPTPSAQRLDAIFEEVRTRYALPGLALGVIRDGKVIYKLTAGEVSAGSDQKIDADTLFKIASNSKAMTTGVLARLVDQGKLRWDDPVVRYLPSLQMSDPWITRELQVRDLLIHNSGLREGAGDLMLWPEPNHFTRADIINGLAHLKPQHSFRSTYDYDNLMYVVAGEVAAAAAGMPYEDLMRRELFEPLGMTRCHAGGFDRDAIGNVAQPHMRQGERNVVIRRDAAQIPTSTSAAAGGIRCSLNDMLTWVGLWLSTDLRAASSTASWLTPARRTELWTPHMPMPISDRQRRWDGSLFNAYGYGWRLSDVDGVLRVAHTGTLAGMYSAVTLLPDMNVGFVFMINGEGSSARTVLNTVLVKEFTSAEQRSVASYAEELAATRSEESKVPDTSSRVPVSPVEAERWLGIYSDRWFGEASVCTREEHVVFASKKSPQLTGKLVRVGDRVLVDWYEESIDVEPWLHFSLTSEPAALTLTKVDPEGDFSYDYEDLMFTRIGTCPDAFTER